MLALAFTALFLQMMVIRWVPAVVKLIAFYANLMLLSSFLGIGAGALASRHRWRLFDYFPLLLALNFGAIFLCRNVVFFTSENEMRLSDLNPTVGNNLVLLAVFGLNALVFVPIGQRMGEIFDRLPRLAAYSWDIAGSLLGTLGFAAFSLLHFSPVWGIAIVMAVYLAISEVRRWLVSVPLFAAALGLVAVSTDPNAIWSPYHYITVSPVGKPGLTLSQPPPDLATMKDPPGFSVSVHHFYYHYNASLDPARYTGGLSGQVAALSQYFRFPYELATGRDRALVLGGGGGGDVQGALATGFRQVDVVEIDPTIVAISKRYNPDRPYLDPRVNVHIDDARAFVARARPGYDAIVYGLLDSHILSSSMQSVRLDGYVYTVEGIRAAYRLLDDDGVLTLAFYIEKDWLLPKLHQLVTEATGRTPAMYVLNRTHIFVVPKQPDRRLPARVFQLQRAVLDAAPVGVAVPTDNWPFLYLRGKSIPFDYLLGIGLLLTLSVGSLLSLRRGAFSREDLHFALLGAGFLLLETKRISDCALYFGSTWLVSAVVIAGVLLMVLGANLAARRIPRFHPLLFVPLFASLALVILVPRDVVLGFDASARLAWALLIVPLPVFFAGIVFSTTFREARVPSAAFGANLIGAMVGGFGEYLAMAFGNQRLSFLVIGAYLLSLLVLLSLRSRRPIAA